METGRSERWKPVIAYESLYEVSDMGRIRRARTRKILRPFAQRQSCGRLFVDLRRDGQKRRHSVAGLVAAAWLPEPTVRGLVVGYRSGTDPAASNLEWITPAEDRLRQLRATGQSRVAGRFAEVMQAVEAAAVHASEVDRWVST